MKDSGRRQESVVVGDIKDERIVMGHGAGGRKMHRLIATVFQKHFGNPALGRMEDSAVLPAARGRLCFTTDSYVVQPLFFPGGDIGRLAVCGTVNDLAVVGAKPLWLSAGFVIREGLPVESLERVCHSMALAAQEAGVRIVTGDTKVIEHGADEGLYINTSGIGVRPSSVELGARQIRPGNAILLSGGIGEHEAAIAVARGSYGFRTKALSDCAPLAGMVLPLLRAPGIKLMRDPTRGGLATTLNEFAEASGLGFVIDEDAVPVATHVRGVAGMLGLDPLYMANEGKVVIIAAADAGRSLVRKLRRHKYGRAAATIGAVVRKPTGVWLRTRLGSLRPLIMLEGEQLPRIC